MDPVKTLFPHHRSNDIVSGVLHGIGLGLAITALIILVIFAGTARSITAMAVFGSGLVLLYLTSALYHLLPHRHIRTKTILQKLDHSMIYVLIAASYTPICLVGLRGGWGWSLFGVSWGLALVGILLKSIQRFYPPLWLSVTHYLLMGWLILLALPKVLIVFSDGALFWLTLGGVLYTTGVIFFSLDRVFKWRWFGMHEVFHLFIIGGSFAHFWLMLWYLPWYPHPTTNIHSNSRLGNVHQ